ncbi:MAG: protein kinase, partial [Thermoguttaceae bacterium]|nr:protein kinase [Thermoguttaceae bacterium]
MTSDSSKFRAASGEPDSTFSDSDATVISGAEPTAANPPEFFDDASTRTSALPIPPERDAEGEGLENERTVVSLEPPTEPPRAAEKVENVDEDGGDGGALPPGAKFGHFVVTKYIGGGGMGRVYEGRDTALDRRVAIKVLPRQRARDVGAVARFLNEAKSAARLNHEHIAQVYFCGEENGVPFIAFEYVRGVNLRDYVRERGVLELGEAIDYVLQAADALAHAAEHGVTHRDVKPSNIIVSPEKSVKLIDMGLARLLKSELDDDLTESGVTLGTFDYISPEQARDPRAADARSDIYSLGCTFYYMLVGTPPFPEGTMLQKLLQHQGDEPPDVREANPEIPVEVAAVVKKMMRKAPEDRYQTPKSLIVDLYEIAEMIGVRLSERGGADVAFDERRTSTVPARAPAALACVLLAFLVVAMRWTSGGSTIPLPVVETPTTPIASPTASNETNATENGGSTAAAPDSIAGTLGGESETSATTVRAETIGETFGAAEIDAALAEERSESDAVPPLVVDDGAEWRRTFLSGSATSGDSKRVAWGWRARRRVAAAWGPAVDGDESASFRALAYSTLGTSATTGGNGATPATTSASSIRTVDRVGGEQTFATLQAALAVGAGTTDSTPIRVELKFDGLLATPPISLVGRKVEIVAVEGFRPTLAFDPRGAVDGWSERMFLLNSSELTLRGVAIDFTVPAQDVVASKWSAFELIGASALTLIDSSATVCNATGEAFSAPLHSNVAVFRSTFDSAALGGLDASTSADGDGAAD